MLRCVSYWLTNVVCGFQAVLVLDTGVREAGPAHTSQLLRAKVTPPTLLVDTGVGGKPRITKPENDKTLVIFFL
jgi:hypothetical protein